MPPLKVIPNPRHGGAGRRRPASVPHPLHRRKPRQRKAILIAAIGAAIGIGLGLAMTADQQARLLQTAHAYSPHTLMAQRQAKLDARIPPGGFKSCAAAKAAGFGRIWKGERAYSWKLDRDGDGKACEWNAGLLD